MELLSLNAGRPKAVDYTGQRDGLTGIDKQPVEGPLRIAAPGPKGVGGSGVAGDAICEKRHHGGDDQAVYAVAREDLDAWGRELGRTLRNGMFGENLTTLGVDVSGALIGERWRIGPDVILEVTSGRIPCATFQGHMGVAGWGKRFTRQGRPGAYLRVIEPGEVRAGDAIEIVHRPDHHDVTVAVQFRAVTLERELLPRLLTVGEALHPHAREKAERFVRKGEKGEEHGGSAPVGAPSV